MSEQKVVHVPLGATIEQIDEIAISDIDAHPAIYKEDVIVEYLYMVKETQEVLAIFKIDYNKNTISVTTSYSPEWSENTVTSPLVI